MAKSNFGTTAVVRTSLCVVCLRGYDAGDFGSSTSVLSKIGALKFRQL